MISDATRRPRPVSARRVALLGLSLAVLLASGAARAHPLAPSLLELREGAGGAVDVRWKQPLVQPTGTDLRPELPESCEPDGEVSVEREASGVVMRWREVCAQALVGSTLRVRGLDASGTDALVRVALADGRSVRAVLGSDAESLVVPARQPRWRVVADYALLGFDHILSGLDHLLFVLGLVLLVADVRALMATVTAFTVGHSVTLSLAALGFVDFPTRPIEIAIAASILVLAVELRAGGPARRARRTVALAGGFGLLHGLGFAGALAQAGLPTGEIPLALFAFNAGIELGQLSFVAVVLGLRGALRRLPRPVPVWLARVPATAIGSLAAFWCIERASALL